MTRLSLVVAVMLLAVPAQVSSARAGNGISFSVGGHRIHIESTRCRSLSCVSVSGVSRRDDDRYRDDDRHDDRRPKPVFSPVTTGTIATVPAPSSPPPPPALPAAPSIVAEKVAPVAPPPVVAAPPPPPPPSPVVAAPPPAPRPVAAPESPRPVQPVSREPDDEVAETPVGDWRTEADGLVRIKSCGTALCGYAIDKTSRDLGEAVLINMKPKQDTQWSGSVYKQGIGSTYSGTMQLKGIDTLRVEACALGRFYCSGVDWLRVSRSPRRVITERRGQGDPRS